LLLISQGTLRQFEKCFCASPPAVAEAQAEGSHPLRRRPEGSEGCLLPAQQDGVEVTFLNSL